MLDILFNWLAVNTGFLFRSQFFISVYESLEFDRVSSCFSGRLEVKDSS
jgi:hypothetical protein